MDVKISGGCLCGEVRYEARQPAVWSHNCHCSRCRKAAGTAFASHLFVPEASFLYSQGEDLLARFEVPEADTYNHVFCSRCGSSLPFRPLIPGLVGIPMGTIDGEPGITPRSHIFVASKASWYDIAGSLPQTPGGFEKPDA